jgi:hypothetical protein
VSRLRMMCRLKTSWCSCIDTKDSDAVYVAGRLLHALRNCSRLPESASARHSGVEICLHEFPFPGFTVDRDELIGVQ